METRSQKLLEGSSDVAVKSDFQRDGFQIIPNLLLTADCDSLTELLTGAFNVERKQSRVRIGGVRNLLAVYPSVRKLASSASVLNVVQRAAELEVFPVRAIFFDKTPEANWAVPWHQDLSIAVAERVDFAGFEGWSVKEGVPHALPPTEILESMVTLRIHLDDCSAANGALRVLAGSHLHGKLSNEESKQWSKTKTPIVCQVQKGGALLMRPLLLHASLPAENPAHRRVLHIEYAGRKLPGGLRWFEEVSA